MNPLLTPLTRTAPFKALLKALRGPGLPAVAAGVNGSQKWHATAGLIESRGFPALIVAASELKAKEIYEDLYFYFKEDTWLYPSRDVIFYAADVKSVDITRQRLRALDALRRGTARAVVLSSEALLDRMAPPDIFARHRLELADADGCITPDTLTRRLVSMGYERCALAEGPGQFAVRGGIADIYPAVARYDGGRQVLAEGQLLRLEFFGDEIDSIRIVDALSQRSVEKCADCEVYPLRELVFDANRAQAAAQKARAEFESQTTALRKKNARAEAGALADWMHTVLAADALSPVEAFSPYFYEEEINLLDYLPPETLIIFDEPNHIAAHMEVVQAEFDDSVTHRLMAGRMLPGQAKMVLTWPRVLDKAAAFSRALYMNFVQRPKDFGGLGEVVTFAAKPCAPLRKSPDELVEDVSSWLSRGYKVAVLAGSRRHGQALTETIAGLGLPARFADELTDELAAGVLTVTRGTMAGGFEYGDCGLAVITDKEIFAREKKRKRAKNKNAAKIDSFTDLRIGDLVVHENHGVGVFKGIEQVMADGCGRDYLKLEYADSGHLYVQTSQMDMIQKYIGAAAGVKLNKLGGADWTRAKARARKAVEVLAADLIALYAKRQAAQAYPYGPDTVWQSEFEGQFPYEETADQLNAIEDVKRDMESARVMDRLICGDVGYGKTEVAIRAAFKAVQDNKQVAFLVPTTILAQQHYLNFTARMKDYPVTIERLSRFQTKKEQATAIKNLSKGAADIVIGTHRLLSKDVQFKDLGLIIVDEEQRFGVSHKERLKAIRADVDVLTLTATPIPRTLHLSLSGIRDMSLLDEPPDERRPVQTYVMEYSADFVRDAITRELSRGGQVYYLHNRVRNIAEEAARVQALVPEAKVAFGHGQMSESELENVMMDFVSGQIQVLVCTTIVETGLDIPNVNTIIIQNADFMGLSQLYQLRGRVGRSNRLAYAYLMYRRDKVLQEEAEKRLQTIRDFTEFGSGFKIAMRDLEIRGAGNLLGAQQHGHMDSIGYDMYCKLLSDAVNTLKGVTVREVFETAIEVNVDAYIPAKYIPNEQQRLEAYKRISLIKDREDWSDAQEELEDRNGNLPRCVQNLLDVALVKAIAHGIGVVSITEKKGPRIADSFVITFRNDAPVDVDKLTAALAKDPTRLLFTMAPNPYLTLRHGADDPVAALWQAGAVLEGLRV